MLRGNPRFLLERLLTGKLPRRRSHGDQAVAFASGPMKSSESLECGQARDPVARERAGCAEGATPVRTVLGILVIVVALATCPSWDTHAQDAAAVPPQAGPSDLSTERPRIGLVLSGGGGNISGIDTLAEDIWKLPVRVGNVINLEGISETLRDPIYATCAGLVLWGNKNRTRPRPNRLFGTGLFRFVGQIVKMFRQSMM